VTRMAFEDKLRALHRAHQADMPEGDALNAWWEMFRRVEEYAFERAVRIGLTLRRLPTSVQLLRLATKDGTVAPRTAPPTTEPASTYVAANTTYMAFRQGIVREVLAGATPSQIAEKLRSKAAAFAGLVGVDLYGEAQVYADAGNDWQAVARGLAGAPVFDAPPVEQLGF